jgi:hypothetical protein
MKKVLNAFKLIMTGLILTLLVSGCGGGSGSSSNEFLGKLPGIAKKYNDKIEKKEKDKKETTSMEKAFKLKKQIDELEDDAEKAIEDYLADNPITNVPFDQESAGYQFTIKDISVDRSSESRITFKANIVVDEDIKNEYGSVKRDCFTYLIAVGKDGNSLIKRPGVMMSRNNDGFLKGTEAEMKGSIDGPADLADFVKLKFLSREEYDNLK